MKAFTARELRAALIRRRIKFVAEKGAMARLFRRGTSPELQRELFRYLQPSVLRGLKTRDAYDSWLTRTVELNTWRRYSRNGLAKDRWAYFAKLINIVVYEIVANRELFSEASWLRIRPLLHVPLDDKVLRYVENHDSTFPKIRRLKGMRKAEYLKAQEAIQHIAGKLRVPPISFEAAWTAGS
jgi:hypothetical protein